MIIKGNTKIHDIIHVEPLNDYFLKAIFDDGVTKEFDMKPYISGGISEELKDQSYFRKVYLENGAITWPNGYDICPVFLRNEV